jgi:hypothetical protein
MNQLHPSLGHDHDPQPCSATNRNGRPCKAYALRDSNPPLCSAHSRRNQGAGAPAGNQNRTTHGFYSRIYTLEEIADLVAHAINDSLDDEIAAARVATRRVLTQLHDDLDADSYAKLAGLVLDGTNTIARLLRTRRALSGDAADGIAGAIAQALDELANEWGVEL